MSLIDTILVRFVFPVNIVQHTDVETPDIILDGINLVGIGFILPTYIGQKNNVSEYNAIFHVRDGVKYLQHHPILLFCVLSMIKELDHLMARYFPAVLLCFMLSVMHFVLLIWVT